MSELFHPLDPSPAKARVDVGTVYVVSVTVSVICSVLKMVRKMVENVVGVAGASSTVEVGPLVRGTPLDVAKPAESIRPLEVTRLLWIGSTTTVVVPVTKASVAGGVLSPSQAVVPFSSEK